MEQEQEQEQERGLGQEQEQEQEQERGLGQEQEQERGLGRRATRVASRVQVQAAAITRHLHRRPLRSGDAHHLAHAHAQTRRWRDGSAAGSG